MTNTQHADAAIAAVITAANALAAAKAHEVQLADRRSLVKSEAISRLMAMPDPQKDGKLYSATGADAIVMTDPAYALQRADEAEAAANTIRRAGEFEAAKLRARLATAGAEIEGFEPLRLALDQAHELVLK